MAQPVIHPELSPLDPYDPGRSLFARLGAILLPVAVLIAAMGVRLDSWIALPGWLRGGLFLAVGMTIGLAIWGWITLRPRRLGLALAATGLAAASIIVLPDLGKNLARFIVPWYTSPVPVTRIVIPYPEPVVARGQSTSIVAYIEADAPVRDGDLTIDIRKNTHNDSSTTSTVHPDSRGLYRYSWETVVEPITYRLRLGAQFTDWFTITPVDPVELRPESAIEIRGVDSTQPSSRPLHDCDRLRMESGGELKFDLQFTRAPANVRLEWQPASRSDDRSPAIEMIPLAMSADGTRGTASWKPKQSGQLRIHLVAEFDYSTDYRHDIEVKPATPAGFATVDGLSRFLSIIDPERPPRITVTFHDQLRITDPILELRHGSPDIVQKVPGERSANAVQFPLRVPAEVPEGGQIEIRLTATIHRMNGDPSTIHFPATQWLPIRIQRNAADPVEQETTAAREWLVRKLHDQRKRLKETLSIIKQIHAESGHVAGWNVDHSVRIKTARNELTQIVAASHNIAEEIDRMPTWVVLARELGTWIDSDIVSAESALQRWSHLDDQKLIRSELARAERLLTRGRDRLDQLMVATDRIASLRLTTRKLQRVRDELATTNGTNGRIDELLREVVTTVRSNPELTAAIERLRTEEKIQITGELDQFLKEQQRLHSAILRTEAEHRSRLLQPIAKQQQEILTELEELRTTTALPLQLASAAPLSAESGRIALQNLQGHQLSAALAEQEKTARELDRIATVLAKAVTARSDHREAVRQLAAWQSRIRTRLTDATETRPTILPQLTIEQQGVATTLAAVPSERLPPPITTQLSAALLSTKQAADAFRSNSPELDDIVSAAERQLRLLADSFPANADRWRNSRAALERLRHEHRNTITELANLKPDLNEKQRTDLVTRHQQLVKVVEALDVPSLSHRRRAAAEAYQQASSDLTLGHLADAAISLRQAGRHLDRLLQSLDGKTPEDERARELAALQSHLAESFAESPSVAGSDRRKSTITLQLELARQFQLISTPEAIPQLERVREATRRAGQLANSATPEELILALREAATAARQLADSLTGLETDLDRAKRLATKLEQAAAVVRQRSPGAAGPREVSRILLELRDLGSDFERTRAGRDQATRTAAANALQQLRESDPARPDPTRYRTAAETFRRLADEMAAQPEMARSLPLPKASAESDPGQSAPAKTLPRLEDARHAERLAERQRHLRDTLSKLNATIALGFSPADADPLTKLIVVIENSLPQVFQTHGQFTDKQSALSQLVPELRCGNPDALARLASLLADPGLGIDLEIPLSEIKSQFDLKHPPIELLAARQAHRQYELVTNCQELLANLERDDPLTAELAEDEHDGLRSSLNTLRTAIREMQSAQRAGDSARQREQAANARIASCANLDSAVSKLRGLYPDSIEMPPISASIQEAAIELRSAVNESDPKRIGSHLDRAIHALENELTGSK